MSPATAADPLARELAAPIVREPPTIEATRADLWTTASDTWSRVSPVRAFSGRAHAARCHGSSVQDVLEIWRAGEDEAGHRYVIECSVW